MATGTQLIELPEADGQKKSARNGKPPRVSGLGGKKLIPFGWYGGKFSHLDWLLPLLPTCHHYCEPFAGSGAVLLNRRPSAVETYNDLDGEVCNFFRVLREHSEELVKAIGLTPFSREEFAPVLCRAYKLVLTGGQGVVGAKRGGRCIGEYSDDKRQSPRPLGPRQQGWPEMGHLRRRRGSMGLVDPVFAARSLHLAHFRPINPNL